MVKTFEKKASGQARSGDTCYTLKTKLVNK